jgi:hypothetical protein
MDGNHDISTGQQLDPNPRRPLSFQYHPQRALGGGSGGGSGCKSRAKSFCHLSA